MSLKTNEECRVANTYLENQATNWSTAYFSVLVFVEENFRLIEAECEDSYSENYISCIFLHSIRLIYWEAERIPGRNFVG
jgi:hypothetical protein